MIGDIKAAALENNRRGVKNPSGFLFTLRAFCLGFVMIALFQLKMMAAMNTLVFVDGHIMSPHK